MAFIFENTSIPGVIIIQPRVYGDQRGYFMETYKKEDYVAVGIEKEFVQDILDARNEADFVVVFAHWGNEYEKEPNDYQRHMAQLMAEGKADVVIGTHPHVVQPVEMMKRPDGGDMLVYYSLGNFRADQAFDEDTKTGAEALFSIEYCYDGVRIAGYEIKEIDAYWKDALD